MRKPGEQGLQGGGDEQKPRVFRRNSSGSGQATQVEGRHQGQPDDQFHVFANVEESQAAAAVFGQRAGDNFGFCFGASNGGSSSLPIRPIIATTKPIGWVTIIQVCWCGVGIDLADIPGAGRNGRSQQRQQEGRFIREQLGQGTGGADQREAVIGVGACQTDAQGHHAEQVERHHQVAAESCSRGRNPTMGTYNAAVNAAGQRHNRQGDEQIRG